MEKRGYNSNLRIRDAMKLLGKLLSVVIIILLIFQLYVFFTSSISAFFLLEDLEIGILRFIVFYLPLFYFAWGKEDKDRLFKTWGKVASILMGVLVVLYVLYGLVDSSLSDVMAVPSFISNIVLVFVLGYFCWFDKR